MIMDYELRITINGTPLPPRWYFTRPSRRRVAKAIDRAISVLYAGPEDWTASCYWEVRHRGQVVGLGTKTILMQTAD